MKIAILGNLVKEISSTPQGGSELFVYYLATHLAQRPEIESIDVFGVGKNHFDNPKINFISLLPTSVTDFIAADPLLTLEQKTRPDLSLQLQLTLATKLFLAVQKGQYDIIHDNATSTIFNGLASVLPTPIASTLHTNFDSPSSLIPYSLHLLSKSHFFIPISQYQLNFLKTHPLAISLTDHVYNGMDLAQYTLWEGNQHNPGIWIGGISSKHNKGLREAILASGMSQKILQVVCVIDDQEFYQKEIHPVLSSSVSFLEQPKSVSEKNSIYAKSSYLLYPVLWEEPFPFVVLESLASGTPVIAYAKGALPEQIVDGVTGFLVNPSDNDIRGNFVVKKTGIEGLCEAIQRLQTLSPEQYNQMRKNSRQRVEQNFTIEKMIDTYLEVYKKILGK